MKLTRPMTDSKVKIEAMPNGDYNDISVKTMANNSNPKADSLNNDQSMINSVVLAAKKKRNGDMTAKYDQKELYM